MTKRGCEVLVGEMIRSDVYRGHVLQLGHTLDFLKGLQNEGLESQDFAAIQKLVKTIQQRELPGDQASKTFYVGFNEYIGKTYPLAGCLDSYPY